MNEYITVGNESKSEYEEKHSRFLGFLLPCESDEAAAAAIAAKRREFWDARHAVYAYVLADGTARFSDDGEPHGTAGKPVLEALKSSGIKNAIVIVVRYFGGILLGTGGLVRAYTSAASQAIENAERVKICEGYSFSVSLAYGDYDKFVFVLKESGAEITETDFLQNVRLSFCIESKDSEGCLKAIKDAFSSSVLPEFVKKTEIFKKI